MAHLSSSGRGGAGNFVDSTKSPKLEPKDLETPTLKTQMVTTGRGGTGNMAKNKDAAETRALQDVQPVTRRESQGAQHAGRGGAGNVFKAGSEDAEAAKQAQKKADTALVDEKDKQAAKPEKQEDSAAAKAKNFFSGNKK